MKKGVFAFILLTVLGAQAAVAMPHCGSRDDVVSTLVDQYDETHRASGLESETGLMEIWASETDGSWTILLTRPDGQTCVMATGSYWLEATEAVMPKGAPA